jgi:hypothetical protein
MFRAAFRLAQGKVIDRESNQLLQPKIRKRLREFIVVQTDQFDVARRGQG